MYKIIYDNGVCVYEKHTNKFLVECPTEQEADEYIEENKDNN